MELGEHIRQRREEAGVSIRGLAAEMRVSPAYLSRVERGLVPPSDDLLNAVAEALECSLEELFLLAGRVPPRWKDAIAESPERTTESLRVALADRVAEPRAAYERTVLAFAGARAIEDAGFPFEHLSDIAELESWRKEVNRPIYHIHKWWAQRLGSVFRAILLGAFAPRGSDIMEMFYQPARLPNAVVFDPFMGSGTTIGEALKLGARAIGRDINPVAHFTVRNALGVHPREEVIEAYGAIERDVADRIKRYYKAQLPSGELVDVLYAFWVKVVVCPECESSVDLFSSYIFSKNASPFRNPEARAVCPQCRAISQVRFDMAQARCQECGLVIELKSGPAKGANAVCPGCDHKFSIIGAVKRKGGPPEHRPYAKMVLTPDGSKEYLPIDDYDRNLYRKAAAALRRRKQARPAGQIEPGYNTNQVLNYCYSDWAQMFNERQLLALDILGERIRKVRDQGMRELFVCLFSGVLEFNNMFASFKGEGTGAVRHMFSHHILKPERTPLEANVWGTPKSSGSFSTLFESRILRAQAYRENPFEIEVKRKKGKPTSRKLYGLSCSLGHDIAESYAEFRGGKQLYLSCGDSSDVDVPDGSVDAVITDPPFFDNVHYSQLADFFYVWQAHLLDGNGHHGPASTRSPAEVQHSDAEVFTERLDRVWRECYRVLKQDGLLVFTYHHSRAEGWQSVLQALVRAGFGIVAAHPIKAEMSVAQPKRQAKNPIDLDVILVCRKREIAGIEPPPEESLLNSAAAFAGRQIERLNSRGRELSLNDARVVLMAQVLRGLSWMPPVERGVGYLELHREAIESLIGLLHQDQNIVEPEYEEAEKQLTLFSVE